uniref:F-box and regulator of chromosome condensation repeat protein n=1 Tax=Pithovirus LCPAC202 TaxID=2506592 RepID=A0A481Z6C6_9VIRU|nr:MAG: F-box and regulator of chromosome condensation repeat protein [Pithovirus LCPAC202]
MDSPSIAVFDLLPDEDVVGILSKIENLNDLFSLCRTSTRIDKICQDRTFWKNKYKQDFGDKYLPEGDLKLPYIIRTKSKESNLLSAGYDHAGMVDKNGILYMWGNNTQGQLGDGTTTSREEPVKILFESKIICISCGFKYTAAVTEKGEVFTWGLLFDKPEKVDIPSKIIKISLGYGFSGRSIAALSEDGLVYHWKSGNPTPLSTPIKMIDIAVRSDQVSYLSMISEDMKLYHSITDSENVTMAAKFSIIEKTIPEPILSISTSYHYTGVLSISGNVYLFGKNYSGQLGTGHPGLIDSKTGLYDIGMSTNDLNKISLLSPIILLSCRHSTTSVITLDNKLYMWGSNLGNKIFIEKDPILVNKTYHELYPKGYFLAGNDVNQPPSFNIEISDRIVRNVGSRRQPILTVDDTTTIEFPSLAVSTQIDIGYSVMSISTGENFSIAKTTDSQLNQWGKQPY